MEATQLRTTSRNDSPSRNLVEVSKVVFPTEGDLDALPMYIDGGRLGDSSPVPSTVITSRTTAKVPAGSWVSFGSYFNSFPAGYWNRWTHAKAVTLIVSATGQGTLLVYRSNARGDIQQMSHHAISDETQLHVDLPLDKFGDGGYYWFEIAAEEDDVTLKSAGWHVQDNGVTRPTVTLAICTFNRPDYCVATLNQVADAPTVLELVDEVVIVDQGTQKVREDKGYEQVKNRLKDKLRIVEQGNLGGSGGFSRGMYETVSAGKSDAVILLDDDILLEPESVMRMTAFSQFARQELIVGGHMFDLGKRSVLHTMGETVEPYSWHWGPPAPDQYQGHDFAKVNFRSTAWMHQRIDVDYNGWWMCMIPVSTIRKIGLGMPIFIKWDDAEYGLRAKEHGIPTVSLPGAAVWHVSWIDKDDMVGWQGYFHARNRLITALMYSPFDRPTETLRNTFMIDVKHLISMQYYTAHWRREALVDVFGGPHQLHKILGKRLPEIRSSATNFSDAQFKSDVNDFPDIARSRPLRRQSLSDRASRRVRIALKGSKAIARQALTPVSDDALRHPQARVSHRDNKWWNVARHDSALVSNAEGSAVSWYKRDPKTMRTLTTDSMRLHTRLLRDWTKLRSEYRGARSEITSIAMWERTFRENS